MHRAVLLAQRPRDRPERHPPARRPRSALPPPIPHDPQRAGAVVAADAATRGLVGRTVAEVERDLIIDTLDHCLGNRTHAANILGISIRTLRNKLKEYTEDGVAVPPPGDVERVAL